MSCEDWVLTLPVEVRECGDDEHPTDEDEGVVQPNADGLHRSERLFAQSLLARALVNRGREDHGRKRKRGRHVLHAVRLTANSVRVK